MRRIEGFSLVELMLVIVILGILVVFVGPVLYNAMRAYAGIEVGVADQREGALRDGAHRRARCATSAGRPPIRPTSTSPA